MCFAHGISERGLQQFQRNSRDSPPPSPEHMGPVASCSGTPGTPGDIGDTDTHTGTPTGLCSATAAATHQGQPSEQAQTRQLRQEQETRGEKTSPEAHGYPGAWFGTPRGRGAVQEKWHRAQPGLALALALALGTAWISWGASAALRVSPEHQSRCDALSSRRRMCQHQGSCAEELPPPSSPWRAAPRIHHSLCSPAEHLRLPQKPRGKVPPSSVVTLGDCHSPHPTVEPGKGGAEADLPCLRCSHRPKGTFDRRQRGRKATPQGLGAHRGHRRGDSTGKGHTFNALGRRGAGFGWKVGNRPKKGNWCLSNPSCDPEGSLSIPGTTET